jgi:hypothetical protein
MPRSDYREGVNTDFDGSLMAVVEDARGKLPGAVGEYILKEVKAAAKEFFRLSYAWRIVLDIEPLAEMDMPFDINPISKGEYRAISILDLSQDGYPLYRHVIGSALVASRKRNLLDTSDRPTEFYVEPPTCIHFMNPIATEVTGLTAVVAVIPELNNDDIPRWVLDNYSEGLLYGTLHRMHNEVQKPYTDPYKAQYFGKAFRYAVQQAKVMSGMNYGRTIHGSYIPRI